MSPGSPPAAELASRLIQSGVFARSRRHADLLQFLVSRQDPGELKETVIGCEFFDRPPGYDPKQDPVVRVEMRRLRGRLSEYYREEGASDPWRLEIPKGAYLVRVQAFATIPSAPPVPWFRRRIAAVAALLVALVLGWAGLHLWNTRPVDSIAVLPLVSSEREPPLLAGPSLSGAITNALSNIGGLRVIGPEASARAQAKGLSDPADLARELGVAAILSGEWMSDGSRVRLQLRLSRGSDREVVWARVLQRDFVNLFDLQDELSASVASAIHQDLLHKPRPSRPVIPAAVLALDRGNRTLARRSVPAIREALGDFESATALDPSFAPAWAALAYGLSVAPDYMTMEPGWSARARAAARRAIDLDPEGADAYAALGWIEFESDLHASLARRLLERAIALNPSHLTARRRLGVLLMHLGRYDEAAAELKRALALDPLSDIARINMAELYFYRGDYAAERRELAPLLAANPHLAVARVMLANSLLQSGNCPAVLEETGRLLQEPDAEGWRVPLANFRARCGDGKLAAALAAAGDARAREESLCIASLQGPGCRSWVERLVREQPLHALEILNSPEGAVLRRDPAVTADFNQLQARLSRP